MRTPDLNEHDLMMTHIPTAFSTVSAGALRLVVYQTALRITTERLKPRTCLSRFPDWSARGFPGTERIDRQCDQRCRGAAFDKSAFPFLEKPEDPVCNRPTSSGTQSDDQTCRQCRCSALSGQFQNANCCSTSTTSTGTNGNRSRSLDLVLVFLVHYANFNAWRVRLLETT